VKKIYITLAAGILTACSQNPQAESSAPKTQAAEPLKATVWTRGGELYLEYPALVRSRKERFAIHLTRLADFRAVKDVACDAAKDRTRARRGAN